MIIKIQVFVFKTDGNMPSVFAIGFLSFVVFYSDKGTTVKLVAI